MNYQTLNNFEEAIHWFDNAVAESNERESWYAYAMLFYMLEDWENCLEKATRCLQVTEQRNGYTFDPRAWSESPYDLAALSSYNCQRYEDAVHYGRQALELRPDDVRLQQNLKFYEAKWETT
jgi:tetratricopeptide (TPR) repeat protein